MIKKSVHNLSRLPRITSVFLAIIVISSLNTVNIKSESVFNKFKKHQGITAQEVIRTDLTFDENINSPIILEKYSQNIVPFQKELAGILAKKNYRVELMRNEEIVVITIPAEQLFIASDTILISKAQRVLEPLMPIFDNDGLYHIVLAFHSDNTGSPTYKQNITRSRVNAVYNWVETQNIDMQDIIPYPMSDFNPLNDNSSVSNRKANRRLEIYLVPDKKMIELAKKNNLNNIILIK